MMLTGFGVARNIGQGRIRRRTESNCCAPLANPVAVGCNEIASYKNYRNADYELNHHMSPAERDTAAQRLTPQFLVLVEGVLCDTTRIFGVCSHASGEAWASPELGRSSA